MIFLPQPSAKPVGTLAFSPDGTMLAAAAGRGRGVCLWDLTTRENVVTLTGQEGRIVSVAYAPTGERLVSITSGGSLMVWSLGMKPAALRTEKWERPPSNAPGHVAFSPDGRTLATTLTDWPGQSWRTRAGISLVPVGEGGRVKRLPTAHTDELTHLAFSPDSRLLAAGSFDRTVSVHEVATRQVVFHLTQGQKVHYLAFSPDGTTLAAGNPQGLVKVWDMTTGRKRNTLKGQARPLRALCYSPDGKVIVTAGGEGIVTFWDVETGKSRTAFDWGIGEVHSVAFAADGMRAAAGGAGQVVVWDIDGWEV